MYPACICSDKDKMQSDPSPHYCSRSDYFRFVTPISLPVLNRQYQSGNVVETKTLPVSMN